MNKAIHLTAIAALTFGTPLALEQTFTAAHNVRADDDWVKAHCTREHPCYNGQVPSFDNPDCWPGAIWCPPAGAPDDTDGGDLDR